MENIIQEADAAGNYQNQAVYKQQKNNHPDNPGTTQDCKNAGWNKGNM